MNRASVVPSTYLQARCSGVCPKLSVQVGLHFRSSMRYLARGRYPFLKSRINAWTINTDYPWISPTCIESRSKYSDTYILNQKCMIISRKASIGMYSWYDKLSWLHCNLVCVLFDPAILTSSFNFIQLFFIFVYKRYIIHVLSS